ncbi:MAG: hypothetical protein JM58_14570 [Peptococcaceae bacterium BICA1-8]|nr:MAG: hypothetical protein JM58_14570 [Peptococcaceae bacterium BICA1-8]
MKRKLVVMILLISFAFLLLSCNNEVKETQKLQPQLGELQYEVVDTSSQESLPSELADWYQKNYNKEGLYSFDYKENTYLLLSLGEKPTAGYGIDSLVLIGTDQEIKVNASLRVPAPDEMVAQVLTYPNILVKIEKDSRKSTLVELTEISVEKEPVQKDSGTYIGLINNNSIEIKISGVPDEISARAFQLADKVKDDFENFGLKTGDQVHFTFYKNNNGQLVLTSIEKIQN